MHWFEPESCGHTDEYNHGEKNSLHGVFGQVFFDGKKMIIMNVEY